jgi:hypothetical protein
LSNGEPKTIKPIETVYNGYRFRSRLEARWAVFFDALGIEYEYEPEGFELPSGKRYLPDFYLPDDDVWVEIKGSKPNHSDIERIIEFCEWKCDITDVGTRFRLLVGGIPKLDNDDPPLVPCFIYASPEELRRFHKHEIEKITEQPLLDFVELIVSEHGEFIPGFWAPNRGDDNLVAALIKARQARFEFGETPRT